MLEALDGQGCDPSTLLAVTADGSHRDLSEKRHAMQGSELRKQSVTQVRLGAVVMNGVLHRAACGQREAERIESIAKGCFLAAAACVTQLLVKPAADTSCTGAETWRSHLGAIYRFRIIGSLQHLGVQRRK